jgi:hypothetical protein
VGHPRDLVANPDAAPGSLVAMQRLAGNEATASLVAQREPDAAAPAPAPTDDIYDQADAEAAADARTAALIEEAGPLVDAGGPLPFVAMYADLEGESTFVAFRDTPVQRLFRYLLERWGLASESMENTAGIESAPAWIGEFRARALNVRPTAGHPGAETESRLAGMAGRLADSVAVESPAQNIRRQFVEEIQGRVGTTVMTQDQINTERSKAAGGGLTPANFTTCIEFFSQVMGQVSAKAGLKAPIVKGPNAYKEIDPTAKETLGDRWKPYRPGARPKPGDLLIFTFSADEKNKDGTLKFGKGWFAHISILRAMEPMEDGPEGPAERWISVDGGGTTASETLRTFYPGSGLIVGPGTVKRTMKGWIDIEAAVEAGLAPRP